MFSGLRPEGSVNDVLSRPSSTALEFIRSTNVARPAVRQARERARRGVVRRDEREVQQIVERDALVGAQVGRRRGVGVDALDRHLLREVRLILEEDDGRHDLGDARDRPLFLGVLLPEDLARSSGSRMIAAAARISGTSAPVASVLKRGVIAVCRARIRDCSRARAAARARASRALRALTIWPSRSFSCVAGGLGWTSSAAQARPAPNAGKATATPSTSAQMRAKFIGRIKRTNPPSRYRLAGGNRVR